MLNRIVIAVLCSFPSTVCLYAQHYVTLKTYNKDAEYGIENISVLKAQLTEAFLKDRDSEIIICPPSIDSSMLKNALVGVKSFNYLKAMKVSEEKVKEWIDEEYIPQVSNVLDHDSIDAFLEALAFFELPEARFMYIATRLAEEYEKLFKKTVAHDLAVENMATLFDVNSHVGSLVQMIPKRASHNTTHPPVDIAIRDYLNQQMNPSVQYKRRVALGFLQAATSNGLTNNTLDKDSWQSLEMFRGSKQSSQDYLAAKIDRTYTEMGKVFFYNKLARCEDSLSGCESQKALIKYMAEHPTLATDLDEAFKLLKECENVVFGFWDPQDRFEHSFSQMLFSFGIFKNLGWAKRITSAANTNPVLHEISERIDHFLLSVGSAASVVFSLIASASLLGAGQLSNLLIAASNMRGATGALSVTTNMSTVKTILQLPERVKMFVYFRLAFLVKLAHLSDYLKAIMQVTKILDRAIAEGGAPKELILLQAQLNFTKSGNKIGQIYEKLQADTFKGMKDLPDKSTTAYVKVLKDSMGLVIACYEMVHRNKQQLAPIIAAAGQLDAHLSVVRLLRESKDKEATYCLPEFVQGSVPFISIIDGWNPMISPEKVVSNSFDVGCKGQKRCTVITGPNAGGKSTIMKSMVISIIMAQSLGIAPARSITFTPFSQIRAYLNIIDDTAGGNSLFVASVKRARELYTSALNIKKGSFSLTVFDEIFNGTSAAEGEAAACALVKDLAECPSNILLVTTHFKQLTRLPGINNKKVTVDVGSDRKLRYPFKLEEGISDQNIAFDVLRDQGFDQDFVDRSKAFLTESRK